MTRQSATWRIVFPLLAALGILVPGLRATVGLGAEPDGAPTKSAPTERPPFRELLRGEDYQARREAVMEKIGTSTSRESKNLPPAGLRLVDVRANGVASELGLRRGDILVRLDGRLLNGDELDLTGKPQQLQYYSVESDSLKTVRIRTERLGVYLEAHWMPERLYLGRPGNPKWDDDVLLGIAARRHDLALAETAWHRALAVGYPADSLSDQVGAEIALMQNRPETAAAFAWFARQATKETPDVVSPTLLYRVALANGDLTAAREVFRQFSGSFRPREAFEIESLIALEESRPADRRAGPPPSVRMADMYRDNLIPRLRASDYNALIGDLQSLKGGTLSSDVLADHVTTSSFETADPAPNFDLSFTITAEPADQGLVTWDRAVMLRIFGEPSDVAADTDEEPESPLLMVVGINQSGQVLRSSVLPAADGALLSDLTVRNRLTGEHQFRVIRVDGRAEVFFNGHRIFLGPIDTTPRVRFQLAVIGTKMKLHSLKLEELLPRKLASQ